MTTAIRTQAPDPAQADARDPYVRHLGVADYDATWHAMRSFTTGRSASTPDEIWVLEHPPVYTVGVAGKAEHLPRVANGIPVIRVDRGGQITYHGPGQIVAYLLLDLRRRGLGIRPLVRRMEGAVIDLLHAHAIEAAGRPDAPGVYVNGAKIAALGLRIKNGCCYHGLALNVDMDLAPFRAINPCGYPGLAVTQLRDLNVRPSGDTVRERLVAHLLRALR